MLTLIVQEYVKPNETPSHFFDARTHVGKLVSIGESLDDLAREIAKKQFGEVIFWSEQHRIGGSNDELQTGLNSEQFDLLNKSYKTYLSEYQRS